MKSENCKIQRRVSIFVVEFERSLDSINSIIELRRIEFTICDEIEKSISMFSFSIERGN
jgi:hypothetical protein